MIVDRSGYLIGIVTAYDTSECFRERAERWLIKAFLSAHDALYDRFIDERRPYIQSEIISRLLSVLA